jgi:TRAP-type C4-dicarboxylate transport system permease small subunit
MREAEGVFGILLKMIKFLNHIGGAALTCMMFLTVTDVIMRAFGHPIMGTYEIVGQSLALVIGFGIPKVSFDRGHVYMEFITDRLSKKSKAIMNTFTRLICIGLFILITYNLFGVGNEFRLSGEVTSTLRLPFFPLAYGVGVCCFLQCFVFLYDIVQIWRGEYE